MGTPRIVSAQLHEVPPRRQAGPVQRARLALMKELAGPLTRCRLRLSRRTGQSCLDATAVFAGDEMEWLIDAAQRSPVMDPVGRVKLMKRIWDAIGSEFGSRRMQFGKSCSGLQFAVRGYSYRFHDWGAPWAMVKKLMAGDDLPGRGLRAAE